MRQALITAGLSGALVTAGVFIAPIETGPGGPQLQPYADLGGVQTYCYGETARPVKERYTKEECIARFAQSLQEHWEGIEPFIPENAPESVKAAMLSVAYNVGVSGWKYELGEDGKRRPSRLRVALAQGDWNRACAAITAPWQGKHGVAQGYKATVRGAPVRGLENRRKAEEALCRADL